MFAFKAALRQSAQAFRVSVRSKKTKPKSKNENCTCEEGSDSGGGKKSDESFQIHPGYLKFKEKQREYQANDGNPIWLKKPTDQYLFGLTWLLMFIAVSMQMQMVYDMSVKKK